MLAPSLAPPAPPLDVHLRTLIQLAIREDLAGGDRTSELTFPPDHQSAASVVARKPGILAGGFLLPLILREYQPPQQPALTCKLLLQDASPLMPDQPIAALAGQTRALLSAERVLLNFLGHLSGIATLTQKYADTIAAAVPQAAQRPLLCDTRKTIPAFRLLDKYAVLCGGGTNLRLNLSDGVMLKDNHLAALRDRLGKSLSLAQLTATIRSELDASQKPGAPRISLWLEVDTLDQLRDALSPSVDTPQGADIILLDNFTPEAMRQAVQFRDQSKMNNQRPKILLEASGGVTLDNLAVIAQTGVDRISIGALTHSAPVLDVSMELK